MHNSHKRLLLIAILGITIAAGPPTAAQVLPGPVIVNDPINKVVLIQQLQQLEQQLQIAEANIKNIGAGGWGSTVQDVQQVNSELSGLGNTVSGIGPRSVPAQTAVMQMQQMPSQESDLTYAQQLSDEASGQVQVTAAGNRLQSLAIGQMQEARQLMLSNVLQTEAYEQQDTAAQTNPAEANALDGKL